MKSIKFLNILSLVFVTSIILTSCGDDGDDSGSSSVAILEDDKMSAVGSEVSISFSESTAPSGFVYELTYASGPTQEIVTPSSEGLGLGFVVLSTTDNTQQFTFTPLAAGEYSFRLDILDNTTILSTDVITITASGALPLTQEMLSDLLLLENLSSSGSDYLVTENLTISSRLEIEGGVQIEFGGDFGIIIDGGALTVENDNVNFIGSDWKGFLLKSGTLSLLRATVSGAGAGVFDGYDAAVITAEGGSLSLNTVLFENSSNVNLNLFENVFVTSIVNNTFDLPEAIHTTFFSINSSVNGNIFSSADALVTIQGQGDVTLNPGEVRIFAGDVDYLFKGGVNLSGDLIMELEPERSLFMEENTGLIVGGTFTISGNASFPATVTGEGGSSWRGLYGGNNGFLDLSNLIIDNAGSSDHSFNAVASAVYKLGNARFSNVTIQNSNGYGLYDDGGRINGSSNLTFTGNELADLVAPVELVTTLLGSNATITEGSVVLKPQRFVLSGTTTIPNLGDGNHYLVDEDLPITEGTGTLTVEAGVTILFDPDVSLTIGKSIFSNFDGTSTNPIILDASNQTSGWGGIYLQTTASTFHSWDYVQAMNGGTELFSGALAQGNLVLNITGSSSSLSFTNCTFSNSKSYGVVIVSGSETFAFEDAANNNTFTGNAFGDVNE